MNYNRRQFAKVNDKKVLHKIKKQWVTISVAMLGLLGLGAGAYTTTYSASANTNDKQPIEKQITDNMANARQQAGAQAAKPAQHQTTPTNPQKIEKQAGQLKSNLMHSAALSAQRSNNLNATSSNNKHNFTSVSPIKKHAQLGDPNPTSEMGKDTVIYTYNNQPVDEEIFQGQVGTQDKALAGDTPGIAMGLSTSTYYITNDGIQTLNQMDKDSIDGKYTFNGANIRINVAKYADGEDRIEYFNGSQLVFVKRFGGSNGSRDSDIFNAVQSLKNNPNSEGLPLKYKISNNGIPSIDDNYNYHNGIVTVNVTPRTRKSNTLEFIDPSEQNPNDVIASLTLTGPSDISDKQFYRDVNTIYGYPYTQYPPQYNLKKMVNGVTGIVPKTSSDNLSDFYVTKDGVSRLDNASNNHYVYNNDYGFPLKINVKKYDYITYNLHNSQNNQVQSNVVKYSDKDGDSYKDALNDVLSNNYVYKGNAYKVPSDKSSNEFNVIKTAINSIHTDGGNKISIDLYQIPDVNVTLKYKFINGEKPTLPESSYQFSDSIPVTKRTDSDNPVKLALDSDLNSLSVCLPDKFGGLSYISSDRIAPSGIQEIQNALDNQQYITSSPIVVDIERIQQSSDVIRFVSSDVYGQHSVAEEIFNGNKSHSDTEIVNELNAIKNGDSTDVKINGTNGNGSSLGNSYTLDNRSKSDAVNALKNTYKYNSGSAVIHVNLNNTHHNNDKYKNTDIIKFVASDDPSKEIGYNTFYGTSGDYDSSIRQELRNIHNHNNQVMMVPSSDDTITKHLVNILNGSKQYGILNNDSCTDAEKALQSPYNYYGNIVTIRLQFPKVDNFIGIYKGQEVGSTSVSGRKDEMDGDVSDLINDIPVNDQGGHYDGSDGRIEDGIFKAITDNGKYEISPSDIASLSKKYHMNPYFGHNYYFNLKLTGNGQDQIRYVTPSDQVVGTYTRYGRLYYPYQKINNTTHPYYLGKTYKDSDYHLLDFDVNHNNKFLSDEISDLPIDKNSSVNNFSNKTYYVTRKGIQEIQSINGLYNQGKLDENYGVVPVEVAPKHNDTLATITVNYSLPNGTIIYSEKPKVGPKGYYVTGSVNPDYAPDVLPKYGNQSQGNNVYLYPGVPLPDYNSDTGINVFNSFVVSPRFGMVYDNRTQKYDIYKPIHYTYDNETVTIPLVPKPILNKFVYYLPDGQNKKPVYYAMLDGLNGLSATYPSATADKNVMMPNGIPDLNIPDNGNYVDALKGYSYASTFKGLPNMTFDGGTYYIPLKSTGNKVKVNNDYQLKYHDEVHNTDNTGISTDNIYEDMFNTLKNYATLGNSSNDKSKAASLLTNIDYLSHEKPWPSEYQNYYIDPNKLVSRISGNTVYVNITSNDNDTIHFPGDSDNSTNHESASGVNGNSDIVTPPAGYHYIRPNDSSDDGQFNFNGGSHSFPVAKDINIIYIDINNNEQVGQYTPNDITDGQSISKSDIEDEPSKGNKPAGYTIVNNSNDAQYDNGIQIHHNSPTTYKVDLVKNGVKPNPTIMSDTVIIKDQSDSSNTTTNKTMLHQKGQRGTRGTVQIPSGYHIKSVTNGNNDGTYTFEGETHTFVIARNIPNSNTGKNKKKDGGKQAPSKQNGSKGGSNRTPVTPTPNNDHKQSGNGSKQTPSKQTGGPSNNGGSSNGTPVVPTNNNGNGTGTSSNNGSNRSNTQGGNSTTPSSQPTSNSAVPTQPTSSSVTPPESTQSSTPSSSVLTPSLSLNPKPIKPAKPSQRKDNIVGDRKAYRSTANVSRHASVAAHGYKVGVSRMSLYHGTKATRGHYHLSQISHRDKLPQTNEPIVHSSVSAALFAGFAAMMAGLGHAIGFKKHHE